MVLSRDRWWRDRTLFSALTELCLGGEAGKVNVVEHKDTKGDAVKVGRQSQKDSTKLLFLILKYKNRVLVSYSGGGDPRGSGHRGGGRSGRARGDLAVTLTAGRPCCDTEDTSDTTQDKNLSQEISLAAAAPLGSHMTRRRNRLDSFLRNTSAAPGFMNESEETDGTVYQENE